MEPTVFAVQKTSPKNTHSSLLFVCLGNICRSPAALTIFSHIAKQNAPNLHFHLDSCAVGRWSLGEPADERIILACHKKGFEVHTDHKARLITKDDFQKHDYILAVEHSILKKIEKVAPKRTNSQIELLTKYSDTYQNEDIPDPYYGSVEAFDAAVAMIEDACIGLVEYFLKNSSKI